MYEKALKTDKKDEYALLRSLKLIDAPRAAALDALTRLACDLLGVPIALICFLDDRHETQHIKSSFGLPEPLAKQRQFPYSHSFCKYVKRSNAPLVVGDARLHDVLKHNPALRDFNVCAYLGVPVFGPDGTTLGTVCALDSKPREWSEEDQRKLTDLALCVTREVSLRWAVTEGQEARAEADSARESLAAQNACRDAILHAFMGAGQGVEERFNRALKAAVEMLGMASGNIAHVSGETAEIVGRYVSGRDATAHPDAASEFDMPIALEGTFAARLVTGTERVALSDCAMSGNGANRSLCGFCPESYLGAPLVVEGVTFGILEFVGLKPREGGWSATDLALFDHIRLVVSAHLEMLKNIRQLRASEAAIASALLDQRETLRQYAASEIGAGTLAIEPVAE
ncbi:hypothetical protein NBRC116596_05270 [Litorivita sp. NS0012-18]